MKIFRKIPVSISLSFWIVSLVIGYLSTHQALGTAIWALVIFCSVLVHELGHALAASAFGCFPRIELFAFGGMTRYSEEELSLGKRFCIVLAGPGASFGLYLLARYYLDRVGYSQSLLGQCMCLTEEINLFWSLLNLIPVFPLDGGRMLKIGLGFFFPSRAPAYSSIASAALAAVCALFFFVSNPHLHLLAMFFGLFAFQNYRDWKRERQLNGREDPIFEASSKASEVEKAFAEGSKEKALELLYSICKESPKGRASRWALESLAFLEYERGEKQQACDLLLSRKRFLQKSGLYLLQKVAFELGNYSVAANVSGLCFQKFPLLEVSLRAAKSHASQKEMEPCLGWLDTCFSLDASGVVSWISDKTFDPVREEPVFVQWVQKRLNLKKV